MQNLKRELENILSSIDRLGGDTEQLIFEEPADHDELERVEQQLGHKIPKDFKNVLLNVSAHCEISWYLPQDFKLPTNLSEIFSGNLYWDLDTTLELNEVKDGWIREVFPDPEDDYDKIWHHKFVFQDVGNGDYLGIDLDEQNYGTIIYLSHDDGEGHGYKMANNFGELIKNWVRVGCVGAEDWQWLPFTQDKFSGILPDCEQAKEWRKIIDII